MRRQLMRGLITLALMMWARQLLTGRQGLGFLFADGRERGRFSYVNFCVLVAILGSLIGTPLIVFAQTPDKTREFVYGVNAFTGLEYQGLAYPRTVDTIYLLADVTNVISPRESLTFYWPITNEIRVDWDGLNETVDGTLEILQNGQLIATIEQTRYVVQYPDGLGTGQPLIYLGGEADQQYQAFQQASDDFREQVFAYYQANLDYREELQERADAGTLEGEPPPAPEEPAPFIFYSTTVNNGFPVTLDPGRYHIRVRTTDGEILPESRRNLVAFAPTREGVTYSIIPHDKYTFPEESKDPSQVIYAREDSIFYLQPSAELEYNDLYLTRLSTPQSTEGRIDNWSWMPLREINDGTLEILEDGEVVQQIERRNYIVRQITGNTLGYEIHDQATTDVERLRERRPDFSGYAIQVDPERPSFRIRLRGANGDLLPGSERDIHLVNTAAARNVYALPLIPLALGMGLVFWRRSRFTKVPYGD